MKKKHLRILIFMLLALPLMAACGGGDDESPAPIDSQITDFYVSAIKELCNMFGINPNDYYDYWMPQTVGDKVIISLARKSDNRVYVAIYDKSKKAVIYRNADISFANTISVPSYDKTFEGKLANIYPCYGETDQGFILNVLVWYTKNGEIDVTTREAMCMQTLLYNDGTTTRSNSFSATADPYVEVGKWFDNSCLLMKQYEGNACYSVKGELLWENKPIYDLFRGYSYYKVISNDEYIHFDYSGTIHSVCRYNVHKMQDPYDGRVWGKQLKLIDNYTDDLKIEYNIEDSSTTLWQLSTKFIWEDGTVKITRYTLDIETGEYTIKN